MKLTRICAALAALATMSLLIAGPAAAQAARTWISGVGDDVNPCSRTAPCKTFAGAISKTATGGEIDCLDPGSFGTVTITKSITLDCGSGAGGQVGAILASGSNAINVNGMGGTVVVTIRNLSITGMFSTGSPGLNGIKFANGGGALHVENVEVFGFAQAGIDFENTAPANLFVRTSQISDCNVSGQNIGGAIWVKPSGGVLANASIYQTRMDRSLFGLRVEDGGKAAVQDSVAHANNGNGYVAVSASAPAEINIINSVASNTVTNGVATSGAQALITLANSMITDNGTGINTAAGGAIKGTTPGTNVVSGNGVNGVTNGTTTLQ